MRKNTYSWNDDLIVSPEERDEANLINKTLDDHKKTIQINSRLVSAIINWDSELFINADLTGAPEKDLSVSIDILKLEWYIRNRLKQSWVLTIQDISERTSAFFSDFWPKSYLVLQEALHDYWYGNIIWSNVVYRRPTLLRYKEKYGEKLSSKFSDLMINEGEEWYNLYNEKFRNVLLILNENWIFTVEDSIDLYVNNGGKLQEILWNNWFYYFKKILSHKLRIYLWRYI